MEIINMEPNHWQDVKDIYEKGIATGHATFQTNAPAWEEWDVSHLKNCRLIALSNGKITGWAALSPISSRCVYSGVAEVSVYIDPSLSGKGIGSLLLQELISKSEKEGIWTLQSGIFPENITSIKIHEKMGFRTLGIREKIGKQHGIWRDTVLMERRSKIAGQD